MAVPAAVPAAVSSAALALLVAVLSGCNSGEEALPSAPEKERPAIPRSAPRHVLVISIDTLRADHLGCYGHPFVQSPNLDRLASQGVRFTQCVSTASTTLASHTSLMSGRWPHDHGVVRNGFRVPDDVTTLAEVLQTENFATAAFIGAAPLDRAVNFDQGFDTFDADFTTSRAEAPYERSADAVTDAVLGYLDAEGSDRETRHFLFVHYFDVHSPFTAPAPYRGMYLDRVSGESATEEFAAMRDRLLAEGEIPGLHLPDRQQAFLRQLRSNPLPAFQSTQIAEAEYCAEITWTDHEIGRLVAGLESRGLWNDALCVVTADHGETMQEHLAAVFSHGQSVYDTEIHVPLIVRFTGAQHAGLVFEGLTSSVDVFPSLLTVLGLPIDPALPGAIFPFFSNERREPRSPVFAEATKPHCEQVELDAPWPNSENFQCVRTDRYKYLQRTLDGQVRLFDLHTDPLEQHDLSGEPQFESLERQLRLELEAWRAEARPVRTWAIDSDDQIEALRALGYLEEANAKRPTPSEERGAKEPR